MNILNIFSFSPRKVIKKFNELGSNQTITIDANTSVINLSQSDIVQQSVMALRVMSGVERRQRQRAESKAKYDEGLLKAMSMTSFTVAEPVPCKSNVCDCDDCRDVDVFASETVGIIDAFEKYIADNKVDVFTRKLDDNIMTVFCNMNFFGVSFPIKITFPRRIEFESIYCVTCGTHIGWCTEINGRGFTTTPDEFIEGLFTDQINNKLEVI